MLKRLWIGAVLMVLFGIAATFGIASDATPGDVGGGPNLNPARQVLCPPGDLIAIRHADFQADKVGGTASPTDALQELLTREFPALSIAQFAPDAQAPLIVNEVRLVLRRNGDPRMVVTLEQYRGKWILPEFVACRSTLVEGVGG